jgi:2,5-diketo-D-gluconate reductase A
MTHVPTITLNNGVVIPQLGFVSTRSPRMTRSGDPSPEVGYRHIDTAEMYGNEKQVGEAVSASGLDRSERSSSPANSTTDSTPGMPRLRPFDGTMEAREPTTLDPRFSSTGPADDQRLPVETRS